jgi:hypothetical protein
MCDFLILGYPRSATTWLANLFTTEKSICLHEPIATMTMDEIKDHQIEGRYFGASCTGLWMNPEWVNSLDCPVVYIDRDKATCDTDLIDIGIQPIPDYIYKRHEQLKCPMVKFSSVWDENVMEEVWNYLLPHVKFDKLRYNVLKEFNVQPNFGTVRIDRSAVSDFQRKVSGG